MFVKQNKLVILSLTLLPPADATGSTFALASEDEAYTLSFSAQVQTRYTLNLRDEEAAGDELTSGFSLPRTTLRLDGTAPGNIGYAVQGFAGTDGGFVLEEAAVTLGIGRNWSLSFGTLALPLLIEDGVFDFFGQAVDQSAVNAVFAQGDSEGVILTREDDASRLALAFSDGLDTVATDFDGDRTDFAISARADLKSETTAWGVFDEFPSFPGSEFAWRVGGAVHHESGDLPTGHRALTEYTADLHLKGDGWNAFAAYVGRTLDAPADPGFFDQGVVLQGGLFITDDIEPFARYDALIPDGDRPGDDVLHTITAGLTWYLHGHAFKCTVDCVHLFGGTAGNDLFAQGDPAIGVLADEGEQTTIRMQIQVLF